MDIIGYFKLARDALKRFPAAKWLFGVIALIAVISLAAATTYSWQVFAFGGIGVFVCSGMLAIAGAAYEQRRRKHQPPGATIAFVWLCLFLFAAWSLLFTCCVFFSFPKSPNELFGVAAPVPKPPGPDVRVFFSEFYSLFGKPKSDFELERGKRTLLFVWIPHLEKPIDRLVLGTAIVRPVNVGSQSMSSAQLTTIYSKDLWHPSLGLLDRKAVVSLVGKHDFAFHIQQIGDEWIATRDLPRLDPMTGAPCPVFFILQVHGSTTNGEVNLDTKGKMRIIVRGPDWIGINHVLDVRCIPAKSEIEFVATSRAMASSLRDTADQSVPVILAMTAGHELVALDGGPTVVQAKVDILLSLKMNAE